MANAKSATTEARVRVIRDRLLVAAEALSLRRPIEFEEVPRQDLKERVGASVRVGDPLFTLWRPAAPLRFSVPFSPERLVLYRPDELAARQVEYVGPGWDPSWTAIGDSSADPVIADVSQTSCPILLALHGTGSWKPSMIAPDPCAFLEAIAVWLEVLGEFDGSRLDAAHDFEVKPGFDSRLAERLEQVLPEDCAESLVRYIQT